VSSALEKLDGAKQAVVRNRVKELLKDSDAFKQLNENQQRALANALVNVVAYLADPSAGQGDDLASALTTQRTGAERLQDRMAAKQDIVQNEFSAAAGREGAEIYQDIANAVDFPDFVGGLIDGVFQSIVKASIQQMEAYGDLLAQVVKSVDEFARDNFTPNQGRDYLVERFPRSLQLSVQGGAPRLVPTEAGEENGLADVREALQLGDEIDLRDEESEQVLAQHAQLEMARLRQKQLATMVLMGINRIVVTDGLINAKVLIDVRTTDRATRTATAAMHDEKNTDRRHGNRGGWFSTAYDHTHERHKTLVTSATDDTSESRAETRASLTGEVRVNFKSETFPLERLASQTELGSVNERAGQ
jgi:ribosome-binding factor A